MPILIGGLLGILVIVIVLYPFLRGRVRPGPPIASDAGPGSRETIYEDIKVLQLDYELGSIDEGEYGQRLRAYRLEAAASMRDEERLEIEVRGSQHHELPATGVPDEDRGAGALCASCGQPLAAKTGICAGCGRPQVPEEQGKGDGGKDARLPH